jgi:hypothetical protein
VTRSKLNVLMLDEILLLIVDFTHIICLF